MTEDDINLRAETVEIMKEGKKTGAKPVKYRE